MEEESESRKSQPQDGKKLKMHCRKKKKEEKEDDFDLTVKEVHADEPIERMDLSKFEGTKAMDMLKRSKEELAKRKIEELEALAKSKVKKIEHDINVGGMVNGVYGAIDLVYCPKLQEYHLVTKVGDVHKFNVAGKKIGSQFPSKKFMRFVHIEDLGYFVCYNPGKSVYFIFRDDWTLALDSVAVSKIDKMYCMGKKTEEGTYEFFTMSGVTVNKYAYNPSINSVRLVDSVKMSDIEAEHAEIEEVAFDQPNPEEDKKQWIYITFRQHVSILDELGRDHGTKKNLHKYKITAIVAYGPSEMVVTGDERGNLKMWGLRWYPLGEIEYQNTRITHLICHPAAKAVLAFSVDQTVFAWSLDTKQKLESVKAPEVVERIAVNVEDKQFVTSGPRKLVLWTTDVRYTAQEVWRSVFNQIPIANIEEDLKQIVEGNHQFSIYVPDFRKMTKKQIDEYGKQMFPDDGNKRKMFVSESRIECLNEMKKHAKDIESKADAL